MGSTIFSGNSRYATDFQAVIDRSVAIASLPLQQLNNTKNELSRESEVYSSLDTKFAALDAAITALGQSTGLSAFSAQSSEAAYARARAAAGIREGSYTIDITSLGAQTSTMSADVLPAVSDPDSSSISSAASFTLNVNGTAVSVTPASATLSSLVDAINALPSTGVQAAIVNVGSNSSPDYRLSISGTQYRADTISLNDGSQELVTVLSTGANVEYRINGAAAVIHNDSRTITLSPGLTVDLLQRTVPGAPVTISVTRNSEALGNGLAAFVDAYNACIDELDAQRGENAGALSGQSIVSSLSGVLRSIALAPGGSSAISSLNRLGVILDRYGHLTLDRSVFESEMASGVGDAFAFLGSRTGGGFLAAAGSLLDSVEAPATGILKDAISGVTAQMKEQDELIAAAEERVELLRETLQQQMAAADAMIASLEQQVSYFTGLFEATRLNQRSNW
jgi:flagellar hook-associated protein 2